MRLGSFRYLVKQGWKSMAANRLMTFASIGVLTACLILTGIAGLLSLNVNSIVAYLGSQNEIVVYVKGDADEALVEQLGTQIDAIENVDSKRIVTKEDAFAEVAELLGEDYAYLLRGREGIFPVSYRVTVKDLALLDNTVEQLRPLDGVDSISSPTQVAGVIVQISKAVTYGGWALVLVLGIVSVIIISNTIRLTVFARRREISIMKYVGATNTFIRLPFFIEGMTVGIIAGLLGSGVVCGAYYLVLGYIHSSTNLWVKSITNSLYPLQDIWYYVVIVFVIFGAFIGSIGTANSIRKHLKV